MLWQQLDAQCKAEDDCHVLTIPHNINWADGGPTFAVESEDSTLRTLRAKFERLSGNASGKRQQRMHARRPKRRWR